MSLKRIPATVITGFLGAGKTTLLRQLLEASGGRRIAVIVNEFGSLGIDGETLRSCGVPGCRDEDIVELANGCLCCTVADDFVPTMLALIDRPLPPDHIVIETSGLALPKPLLKAFNWPSVKSRLTVDGVIAVVDAPAVLAGRFADDPDEVARIRAQDAAQDHDNPLEEVFTDQIRAADMIILNKADLLDEAGLASVRQEVTALLPVSRPLVTTAHGKLDPAVVLGLDADAQNDLDARPSHHDAVDGEHEHDDFTSFVASVPEVADPDALVGQLAKLCATHDILRMKGFVPVAGKELRLAIQGVGTRFHYHFDRPWEGVPAGQMVVIGQNGIDENAIRHDIEMIK